MFTVVTVRVFAAKEKEAAIAVSSADVYGGE